MVLEFGETNGDVVDDNVGFSSHSERRPVVPSLSLPLPESLLCIR